MFCPKCSQPQVSTEAHFCCRCGLPLANLKELLTSDAAPQHKKEKAVENKFSERQKGLRQGVMLMLLSAVLIPAAILLAALFPANDRLIESSVSDTPFEKISQAVLFTIFMLGLARLLYARLFQSATADEENIDPGQLTQSATYSLPTSQSSPVSGLGKWRETGEIVESPKHN